MVVIFSSPPPVPSVLSSHPSLPFLLIRLLLLLLRFVAAWVSAASSQMLLFQHFSIATPAVCSKPTLNSESYTVPACKNSYSCNPYVSKPVNPSHGALIIPYYTAAALSVHGKKVQEACRLTCRFKIVVTSLAHNAFSFPW